jgi:large subunit ribosomal protein L10
VKGLATKEDKAKVIDELTDEFSKADVGVLIDYRGLPTAEMNLLRGKLRQGGNTCHVVKNTLARFAAEKSGKKAVVGSLKGPMAIAFGRGDTAGAARIVTEYVRDSKVTIAITGGFLGDRVLSSSEVQTLAMLPPREILLSRVLGQMNAPIAGLAGALASPIRGFIGILNGRIEQMEEK